MVSSNNFSKRMIQRFTLCCLFWYGAGAVLLAQQACPTCNIQLPANLPTDTLWLAQAPNGRAGQAYSGDISFRLPRTTTPVAALDSTVTPGITIQKITITGLTNLPPGLNWFAPQVVFPLPDSTDGCIRICGTPLQAGTYLVNVVLTAQVFIFTQTANFTFPIIIEPAQSATQGFTIVNASGCGQVTASFINNVPSGGSPGFSYLWNFGNGNYSIEENPVSQTYSAPGQYPVHYQAVIDTTGHRLTRVRILQLSCSDLFNGPDVQIFVYAPDSTELFRSSIVQNAVLPVEFLLNLPIGVGNHRLRVIDVDAGPLGGADDECGIITFNRTLSGELTAGPLRAVLDIIHLVDTVRSSDTIRVYAQPAEPQIMGAPDGNLCDGETLTLAVDYPDNLQWYKDSIPVLPGNTATLDVQHTGVYHVDYTSPEGCRVSSAPAVVQFVAPPDLPVFTSDGNRLYLFDPGILPAAFQLQWYRDGEAIAGAVGTSLCIADSGFYTLELRNTASGCVSRFGLPVNYNPNAPPCLSTRTEENQARLFSAEVFPNPADGDVQVKVAGVMEASDVHWALYDGQGRRWAQGFWPVHTNQAMVQTLPMQYLPAGLYILWLQAEQQQVSLKIIKR